MWLALTIISLAVSVARTKDCPGMFDWGKYCCQETALGCYDDSPLPCCYDDSDVTYSLYTRSSRDDPQLIHRSEPLPSQFLKGKKTVFVSHGYMSDGDTEGFINMKNAFLDKEDINVVVLDWPSHNVNYFKSAHETGPVGKLTAQIMNKVVDDGGTSYSDIWCIGHSLGSHICGFAGRTTPQKIGRITGLDPAGPAFEGDEDITVGLNPDNAQFVDVIHTDTKATITMKLGTIRPLGHMDFYVNGLEEQPGCTDKKRNLEGNKAKRLFDTLVACSHSRVYVYFTETLSNPNCFVSRSKCTDVKHMPGSCSPCGDGGVCAVMGYDAQGSGENGIYYVDTSDEAPYCTPAP